jgi:two-component system, LuxR family, response regulator FixJ
MNKPTVFIVDDDPIVGQAISWLLSSVCIPTEIFLDAQAYLDAYDASRHGCLLIDVRMPGMSGLELQEYLKQRHNSLPIIMISGHGDVPMTVRAMQAGAIDFILKPFNNQLLLEKIQIAIIANQKQQHIDYQLADLTKRLENLTPRERAVLKEVVAGKMNKQIAADLSIAISTVELHRAKIMKKMEVSTLATLIKSVLPILS